MKKILFTGSGVAIVTPFTDTGIDFPKLAELIEFQIANDTDALIICGTTGESSTMPDAEHKSAIKFAVDTVAGRIPVIAGTGSNDTHHAIELSQYAQSVGADGLLLVSPYYNKTTQKGLVLHFKMIAEAVNLPIILYNVPSRTGMNIAPASYKELSAIENIVAVKEANASIAQAMETAALCGDDLTLYTGNDDMIVPMLSIGGKGVISVVANILPKQTHDMVTKYLAGDVKGAMDLQLHMFDLINNLFIEVNPIPVKTAMNLMGMQVGKLRMPLCDMSDKNLEVLKNSMVQYGLKLQ
ncbi:MAG: 4-hydroxy-tetrahydrodipicolinate synthase [Hyphomonadaceae bacterium]|nr:4-hydroxy-tetrahydrodipicolinate synthase [Clostridia bacterium]